MSGAVASQFVGDQLPRRTALPLQQLAEESFGGFLITARLDEDIDYITILVYRAPEVLVDEVFIKIQGERTSTCSYPTDHTRT